MIMRGDPEYAEGTLFRATQQIDELAGEEELQALIHDGVLVVDETMQAIIDAWSNLKLVTGERAIPLIATGLRETVRRAIPELATAIEDALTEKDNKREPKQGTGLPDPSECPYCAECRPMGMMGCLGHYPVENSDDS